MRRATGTFALALLLAVTIGACGTSEQKRAVDARTEVLRFFGVDTPAVAVLDPLPERRLEAIQSAASGVPAFGQLRAAVVVPLRAAGMTGAELRRLVQPSEEIEGVEASALAVGVPTGTALSQGQSLLVLATDQDELMDGLLRDEVNAHQLRAAGEKDGARLYQGQGGAYAVRDGVLVSAGDLGQVRAAIKRRDGDSDKQLDEDVVNDLFGDLRVEGPVLVYSDVHAAVEADPSLRFLADRTPWIGALGHAAISLYATAGSLRIEALAKLEGTELADDELPAGVTPTSFEISNSTARVLLLPHPEGPDAARRLLLGLAPLAGEATANADEIRARAEPAP